MPRQVTGLPKSTVSKPNSYTLAKAGKKKSAVSKRISNSLVALSSAAIISVYGIGYVRTQAAADTVTALEGQSSAIAPSTPTVIAPLATRPPLAVDTPRPTSTAIATTAPTSTTASATGSALAPTATSGIATARPSPSSIPLPANNPVAKALPPVVAPTPSPTATTAAPASKYKDGSYVGLGYSRHGNIEATVVVKGGKIVSADVTQCMTRYRCSYVLDLVDEVVSTQAPPVDIVSGATDSSHAYIGAIKQALAKAT